MRGTVEVTFIGLGYDDGFRYVTLCELSLACLID